MTDPQQDPAPTVHRFAVSSADGPPPPGVSVDVGAVALAAAQREATQAARERDAVIALAAFGALLIGFLIVRESRAWRYMAADTVDVLRAAAGG